MSETTFKHTQGKCQYCKNDADVEIGLGVNEPCAVFQSVCMDCAMEIMREGDGE